CDRRRRDPARLAARRQRSAAHAAASGRATARLAALSDEVSMPYAQGRVFYDADSHVMELGDWLPQYADPAIRERIRPLALGAAGQLAEQAVADAARRRGDRDAARRLEDALMNAKGWSALGAFDSTERSRALDLLGVDKQLVFSTFAATQFASPDHDLLYGGSRAPTPPPAP